MSICNRLRGLVYLVWLSDLHISVLNSVFDFYHFLPMCCWWKGVRSSCRICHSSHCLLFGFCSALLHQELHDLFTRWLSAADCVGGVSRTCLIVVNLTVSHLLAFLLSCFLSSMWGICLFETTCKSAAWRHYLELIRKFKCSFIWTLYILFPHLQPEEVTVYLLLFNLSSISCIDILTLHHSNCKSVIIVVVIFGFLAFLMGTWCLACHY